MSPINFPTDKIGLKKNKVYIKSLLNFCKVPIKRHATITKQIVFVGIQIHKNPKNPKVDFGSMI